MNNEITFTPRGLLIGLLLILSICAVIFLIVLILKLIRTISKVNKILEDNEKAINQTIKELPGIAENASETLENVKDITGTANNVVSDVGGLVDSFASPEGPAGVIASVAGAVVSIIQIVREFLDK